MLAVIYAPAIGRIFFAGRGAGVWKADAEACTAMRVAKSTNGTVRVVISRSHGSGEVELDGITSGAVNYESITMSNPLKFCLIADGATAPMERDTAAAHCIVEATAGRLAGPDGSSMSYNKPMLLNPGFIARGLS